MTSTTPDQPALRGSLTKLRAAVLGANDGIVSTASVVMGVAGAGGSKAVVITAGLAALVAGALSMAVGEYVSVASQRDAEEAYIARERRELREHPADQLEELAAAYIARGVSPTTAHTVARELTERDALKAHLQIEFGLDEDDTSNPLHAAWASLAAFSAGGLVPFAAIVAAPVAWQLPVTALAVATALVTAGYLSATAGGASRRWAVARVLAGGLAAMAVTYVAGWLFGSVVV